LPVIDGEVEAGDRRPVNDEDEVVEDGDGDGVEVMRGDGRGGGGVHLLLGFLVRIGPKNPVSSGVTPRMRISSSSSGTGSGRSATLRGGDGVAALLAAGFRSNDGGRERGLPRAAPIICEGKRRRGGDGV
jgi:hypothetical protein